MLGEFDHDELFCAHFQLGSSDTVRHTAWVRCSGIEYRCGSVVCIDVVDEMPLFCKVVKVAIILRKKEIHFLLMQMDAVSIEHLHAMMNLIIFAL